MSNGFGLGYGLMQTIKFTYGLPFVAVTIVYQGQSLNLSQVLLDTGSTACVFSVDKLIDIGVQLEPDDAIHQITGVGGSEFVFAKSLCIGHCGDMIVNSFDIEVGMMNYGFDIDGIIGTDFLVQAGIVIDLNKQVLFSD